MRKVNFYLWVLLATVIALSAAGLTGCAKPAIRNLGSAGKNIICLGDSITFGYGAGPQEDYPTALSKLLNAPVINAGVDGDTTFNALKRLEADVLSRDPRLVIVEFCGNDFLKKIPRRETVDNLRQMIKRIQAKGAMVALVDISAGMFMREYRADFSRLARQEQAIFIPSLLKRIITNPSMKSDFLHPNARGYKEIAERVYLRISQYLK